MVGRRPEKADIGGRIGQPGRGAGHPAVCRCFAEPDALGLLSGPFLQYPPQADGGAGGPGPAPGGLPDALSGQDPPQRSGQPVRRADPSLLQEPPGGGDGQRHPPQSGEEPGASAHHPTAGPGGVPGHPVQPSGVDGAGIPADFGERRPCCGPTTRSLPRRPR